MYIPSQKHTDTYLFIFTLHQNHLHKDRFVTAIYLFLLVFFCMSVRKPKRPATDIAWKPQNLYFIIIFYVAIFRSWLLLHWFLSSWFHPTDAAQGYLCLMPCWKPVRHEWPYQQLGCHQRGLQGIETVKVQCMSSVPVRAISHSSGRLPFCCSVYLSLNQREIGCVLPSR